VASRHEYHANTERPQTAKKLSILRKYFGVWLKIWSGPRCVPWVDRHWYVLDLFAGTGRSHGADGGDISGSPLVFLEEIAANASRLHRSGITITLVLREQAGANCRELEERVAAYLNEHPELESIVDLDIRCEDCNAAVAEFSATAHVTSKTPAFVFVDPYGLAIQRDAMNALVGLPWAVDVLFNYMLDGIRRVFGAALGTSTVAQSNAATLDGYFGNDVSIESMAQIEDPSTYATAVFGAKGLRTVAFFMKWPSKEAVQYILLFACRNSKVVDIMREIYAREMKDQYGQASLFSTEEHLAHIEVIEP
jgi:three-Cys-motif partner protein